MTTGKRGVSGFAVASRISAAGIARRAAKELAPTAEANLTPVCSASVSETGGCFPSKETTLSDSAGN